MKTCTMFFRWMFLLTGLFMLALAVGVYAQEGDLKKQPGYVNFDEIKIPDKAGEVTEITLGPGLVKLAAMAADDKDEDLDEVLSNIKGIQVKSFKVNESETETIQPIMDKIEAKLNREGWERLVQVKGEDERVVVSIKSIDKEIVGLLVMSLEPGDEASFVNIVGNIDLNKIGDLGIDLDDSALDSLKKSLGKK